MDLKWITKIANNSIMVAWSIQFLHKRYNYYRNGYQCFKSYSRNTLTLTNKFLDI